MLAKYNLPYTEKDIIQNPAFRWEMETKSGQPLSPCVEINGKMLADISGEEVEKYLIENKLVQPSDADAGVPINAPCANEQHDSAVEAEFVESLKCCNVKESTSNAEWSTRRRTLNRFNALTRLTLQLAMKFFAALRLAKDKAEAVSLGWNWRCSLCRRGRLRRSHLLRHLGANIRHEKGRRNAGAKYRLRRRRENLQPAGRRESR